MSRTIRDSRGRHWDIVVGRESYGMQVLLFFPSSGEGVRKKAMEASTRLDAEAELANLSDRELEQRLRDAQAWDDTGPPT